jgi:glycosyltransferase involved in cell wall biosynthesis
MRLLFLNQAYPPDVIGGLQVRCQWTADGLRQRGHEVLVVTGYPAEDGLRREEHVWRVLRSRYSECSHSPLRWIGVYRHNRRVFGQVLRSFQPEVVCDWGLQWCTVAFMEHVHRSCPVPVMAFAGGGLRVAPEDAWLHFCAKPPAGAMRRLSKALLLRAVSPLMPVRPAMIQYNWVCFNSQYTRNWSLRVGGAKVVHPVVVYNAVDASAFTPPPEEERSASPRFLWAGRITPQKDPITVLRAVQMLRERGIPVSLTLAVGLADSDYRSVVDRELTSLGGRVRLVSTDPSEMPALYREHDVLLFSPENEWFGLVLIEAMACGLAVIATRGGGPDEFLADGENCLRFDFGDAQGLAEQMQRMIHDLSLRQRLGRAGRRLVEERFTMERYLDEVEALLASVVASAAGGQDGRKTTR